MLGPTAYEQLTALIRQAPHRLTGSSEAASTRAWIAEQLQESGLTVELETFEYSVAASISVFGTMLNAWGTVVLSWMAAELNPWLGLTILIVLNVFDFVVAPKIARPIKKMGENVIAGVSRPWKDLVASGKPVLLVTAHTDTAQPEPNWLHQIGANNDTFFGLAAGGLVIMILFFISHGIMALLPGQDNFQGLLLAAWVIFIRWIVILLGLPIVVSSTLWALRRFFSRNLTNPGADDNGSGVAVGLSLVEPLRRIAHDGEIETAVAFFDAEEVGLHGSRLFVKTHADSLRSATTTIVNLDCVGRGNMLGVVAGQGLIKHEHVDPDVLALWRTSTNGLTSQSREIWLTQMTGLSDQVAWLQRGFARALTVMHGVESHSSLRALLYKGFSVPVDPTYLDLRHMHSPADSLEAIAPQALETTRQAVIQFAEALAKRLSSAAR